MNAGIPHAQEPLLPEQAGILADLQARGFTTYNTGISGMPKSWLIDELQTTAARIQKRSDADGDLASRAIACALFDMASGFSESACQAVMEAEQLRGMRA